MKKERMVGARLPLELVRELELIENVEQSDRSTTLRKLLSSAVRQWKLEHFSTGTGRRPSRVPPAMRGFPCGR